MTQPNDEIKNDFKTFEALLTNRKHTIDKIIYLNTKKPARLDTNYYEKTLDYTPDQINLIIEAREHVKTCFRFKLRCINYTSTPFFRFDSDGASHRNLDRTLPLPKQVIRTPHFNSFDKEGNGIAYRTPELDDPITEAILLNDMNLCFTHFCHETNIRYPKEDFSEVIPHPLDVIPFQQINEDPLANINFNGQ